MYWVSIKTQLPDECGWYIVTVGSGKVFADYWDGRRKEWMDYEGCGIKAWMKMPQPYKSTIRLIHEDGYGDDGCPIYLCPNCYEDIIECSKICENCGQGLMW